MNVVSQRRLPCAKVACSFFETEVRMSVRSLVVSLVTLAGTAIGSGPVRTPPPLLVDGHVYIPIFQKISQN